jgi:hypothetical protein
MKARSTGQQTGNWHNNIVWVLIAVFLCQPILAYLATPMAVIDRNGSYSMVCTLQGMQVKLVTEQSSIADKQVPDEECPAIKLLQMIGSTQISLPPVTPFFCLNAIGLNDQAADRSHRQLHFSAYPCRAPPLV